MNIQLMGQFFEKMSGDPVLQKEFVELAARHGIDLSGDQLSEADLAGVSGGGDLTEDEALKLQSALEEHPRFLTTMSNIMKLYNDTQQSIISNIK